MLELLREGQFLLFILYRYLWKGMVISVVKAVETAPITLKNSINSKKTLKLSYRKTATTISRISAMKILPFLILFFKISRWRIF